MITQTHALHTSRKRSICGHPGHPMTFMTSYLQSEETYMRTPWHQLRHPMIFYYGHVAVVYINKLRVAGFLQKVRIFPLHAYIDVCILACVYIARVWWAIASWQELFKCTCETCVSTDVCVTAYLPVHLCANKAWVDQQTGKYCHMWKACIHVFTLIRIMTLIRVITA